MLGGLGREHWTACLPMPVSELTAPIDTADAHPVARARAAGSALRYASLVRTLAGSEFKLRFAHSALGYAWTLSKPLMLFGVMYVVFSEMLKFGAGIDYYPIILLMGIMIWGFFSESTSGAVTILVSRADLVRKAAFPRSALAMSVVATSLLVFACNLVALGVFVALAGIEPALTWLVFPLLLVELVMLTTGVSLLLSGMFVFLRDIGQLWTVALQLLFYATPIIYPVELLTQQGVPETWIKVLMSSPIAQIVQDSRWALVGGGTPTSIDLLGTASAVPHIINLVLLAVGLTVYRRRADRLAEYV